MKKIIMLLSNGFAPDPRVYQEAKSLIKQGFEITIIAWDRESKMKKYEIDNNIKIERIQIKSFYDRGTTQIFFFLLFWINVFFKLIFRDFDIIHCHDFDTLPIGFFIGKLKRKKIIFDAHEKYMAIFEENVAILIKRYISIIEKFLIKYVDALITVGEILREEYIQQGAKNVVVVGNWKLNSEFNIPEERIISKKRELGIPENKLIISSIGWMNEGREIFSLIEAVKKNESIFLLLGGGGVIIENLRNAIKGYNNILFVGFVPSSDIPLYTCISDVIYYGLKENFPIRKYSAPNKLFEALSAGRALLTGDFGEIGRIVKEENCGIILDSFTQSEFERAFKLLLQTDKLSRFKLKAKQAAMGKYNWLNAEKKLIEAYSFL